MERDNSHYHCTSEWHFAQLSGKGAYHASLLYTFSLRLSKNSRTFFCSVPRLADYFGVDERTIRKAIKQLVKLHFWEVLGGQHGGEHYATRYRPLMHREWIERYGTANCVHRLDMPWKDEELDPLGREMYALSGGRFTPYVNFVKGIRNTGHSDAAILEYFAQFVVTQRPNGRRFAKGFAGDFIKYLRNQKVCPSNGGQRMPLAGATVVPS